MVNAGGRPRDWDYSEMAGKILEWAKKKDSVNLNAFCCEHEPPFPPPYVSRWARESEEFRSAYETAKSFLANRREKKLTANELHVKAYDLNATTYDYFLKEEKMREKEFDAEVKRKAFEEGSADLSDYKAWLEQSTKK